MPGAGNAMQLDAGALAGTLAAVRDPADVRKVQDVGAAAEADDFGTTAGLQQDDPTEQLMQ